MRSVLALVILASAACATDMDNCVPASTACTDQATSWCLASGQGNIDCELLYEEACRSAWPDRCIDASVQATCLDDISGYSCVSCAPKVPPVCRATWVDPHSPIWP